MFALSALKPSPGEVAAKRHRIENNLDPTASVRFVDYLVGRLSGRYQPGNPSLHRRKIWDKKSQINDTFFWKKAKELRMQRSFLHDSLLCQI